MIYSCVSIFLGVVSLLIPVLAICFYKKAKHISCFPCITIITSMMLCIISIVTQIWYYRVLLFQYNDTSAIIDTVSYTHLTLPTMAVV